MDNHPTHVFFHRLEYQALQLVQTLIYSSTPPLLHDWLVALQFENHFSCKLPSRKIFCHFIGSFVLGKLWENVIRNGLPVETEHLKFVSLGFE